MESEGFIPSGAPGPGAADRPPAAGETPRVWHALILPVVFTVAAWAVDRFTRSTLGDWRYAPVALLGLCALYFGVLAVVVAVAVNIDRFDGERAPRWSGRVTDVLIATLFGTALIVEIVRAARYHSALDAVSALLIVVSAVAHLATRLFPAMPRARRRIVGVFVLPLPLWVAALALLHLH